MKASLICNKQQVEQCGKCFECSQCKLEYWGMSIFLSWSVEYFYCWQQRWGQWRMRQCTRDSSPVKWEIIIRTIIYTFILSQIWSLMSAFLHFLYFKRGLVMFYTVFMSRSSRQWRAEMIAGGGSVVRGWYEDQHWSHHPHSTVHQTQLYLLFSKNCSPQSPLLLMLLPPHKTLWFFVWSILCIAFAFQTLSHQQQQQILFHYFRLKGGEWQSRKGSTELS